MKCLTWGVVAKVDFIEAMTRCVEGPHPHRTLHADIVKWGNVDRKANAAALDIMQKRENV